jgi:ectoine hydroxylase-related dioxygenase (phytanoyl-CoA dioxygenase family)
MNRPTKQEVLNQLPEGYEFMNYKYSIDGCTLSTFHRDVTSSQYVFKTKHPVYTFITYEYDGTTLSLCPGSHKTTPFLLSRPITVNSNSVLFNCDVVHAGSLNLEKKPRKAVQYKIAHRDDIQKLKHLEGIDKVKQTNCEKRRLDVLYRKLSLIFSYIINHQMTPHLQNRESNLLCKLIGEERCFYNV